MLCVIISYLNKEIQGLRNVKIKSIWTGRNLANFAEFNFDLQDRRIFKYNKEANVILVTKEDAKFGFSISINQNKKLNKPFAYFNLIKLNNFDTFEKVTSIGNPIDLSKEKFEYFIIQELINIIGEF